MAAEAPTPPVVAGPGVSLRPDVLAGHTVLVATPPEDALTPGLAERLAAHGAHLVGVTADTAGAVARAEALVVDLRPAAAGPDGPAAAVTDGFRVAQAAHPALAATGGALVFLLPATRTADPAGDTACATGAVVSLARSLAVEWSAAGVRANTVLAAGDPPELADLVAFLVSPAAAMLTGQLLDLSETTTADPAPGHPGAGRQTGG